MKIVVLDGHAVNPGDLDDSALMVLGDVTVYDRTPMDLRAERMAGADIVLTNKTLIDAELMDASPALKYIGVLATGYNVVDVAAATQRDIVVTNVPDYSSEAVAQHVFALLLEMTSQVGKHARMVREGEWAKCKDFCFWDRPLIELNGKTLGIIGYGSIGQAVARVAAAFGMRVLFYNPSVRTGLPEGVHQVEISELYAQADVISLHCPLFEETRGMIDASAIDQMKDGVWLINTARGPLLVEADVVAALESGKVAGLAADVLGKEPPEPGNRLIAAPNTWVTPHIAWAPEETRQRLIDVAVGNVRAFIAGEPQHVVNG